jgi:hypothetical protein
LRNSKGCNYLSLYLALNLQIVRINFDADPLMVVFQRLIEKEVLSSYQ